MGKESPTQFLVMWTGHALDALVEQLQRTKHAAGNPVWVEQKYEACVLESIRRLEVFPDLRLRYIVAGLKCGAMTLKALPLQVFYRQVGANEIAVFECRWATLDKTGPENVDRE